MAFDPRLIDDIARRLAGAVPESVSALRRDLETNFKGVTTQVQFESNGELKNPAMTLYVYKDGKKVPLN